MDDFSFFYISAAEQLCNGLLVQLGADDHQFAAHVGAAGTHFPLAGHIVELQPAVGTAVHDALAAQDHAVIAGVQLGEGVLHFGLGKLAGRLDAPAGEHLIGVVVMMMVVMAAAAVAAVLMMMLVLVLILVVIVMVVAAAAMLLVVMILIVIMVVLMLVVVIVLVMVVMVMLVLVLIIVIIVVVMAAAAHAVLVVVMVMMVVILFSVMNRRVSKKCFFLNAVDHDMGVKARHSL